MKYFKPEIEIDFFDEDVITVSDPTLKSSGDNTEKNWENFVFK